MPSRLYYPNITLENQNVGYNDMLDKIRTAAAGGAAPDVAKMPILWGVEFAARGDTPKSPSRSSAGRPTILARRAEVGHLGRQALRRADQQ